MAKTATPTLATNLLYAALDTQASLVYQPGFALGTDPDYSKMDTRTLLSCYLICEHLYAYASFFSGGTSGSDWTSISTHYRSKLLNAVNSRAQTLCGVQDVTKLLARWRDFGGTEGPEAYSADYSAVYWSLMSFDQLKATAMLLNQMAVRGDSEDWGEDPEATPAGSYVLETLFPDAIAALAARSPRE